MWIFSDNNTLKKIFDELFDTTKFAKYQENLKLALKKYGLEYKKISEQVNLAKRDIDDKARVISFYI